MCNQKYRCDYAKDLEHEAACLEEMYDDMRALLLRTRKLLDCGPLFVNHKDRIEALSIIEAIEFIKRKNDISLLADLLGHGDVKVTQIYLRQSQAQQRRAIDEAVNW